jgi:hypothetical protein
LFAAMRRALVLAAVVLAGLAAVPALAGAAPARKAPVEREVSLALRAEGFTIFFDTTDNDGELSAYLAIIRGRQRTSYQVPVQIGAHSVRAKFGGLGELDYRYAPSGKVPTRCEHEADGKAHFHGSFTFTGENDYVHIDADQADGIYHVYAPHGCARPRPLRRVVPYSPSYSSEGATLEADSGPRTRRHGLNVTVYDLGKKAGHSRGAIFGEQWEEREGMGISRATTTPLPKGVFRWSLDKGTATLKPPAPFTGSARFVGHGADGHGTWTGTLTMPVLGGERLELAGPAFHAFIHRGVPQDE